jgi:hypothetical protein
MRCEEAEGLLSDHLNGALAPAEADALEAHLAGCPACRGVLAELRWVAGLLQDVPPMAPPPDLGDRIHAALEALDDAPAQASAPKIPCDEAHDYFSGHLEADLDEWEARALSGHLETCAGCRLALKQLEAVKALRPASMPRWWRWMARPWAARTCASACPTAWRVAWPRPSWPPWRPTSRAAPPASCRPSSSRP